MRILGLAVLLTGSVLAATRTSSHEEVLSDVGEQGIDIDSKEDYVPQREVSLTAC